MGVIRRVWLCTRPEPESTQQPVTIFDAASAEWYHGNGWDVQEFVPNDDDRGAVGRLAEIAAKLREADRSRRAGNSGTANSLTAEAMDLATDGGQSSSASCPACSRVSGVARAPHTCSGEQS